MLFVPFPRNIHGRYCPGILLSVRRLPLTDLTVTYIPWLLLSVHALVSALFMFTHCWLINCSIHPDKRTICFGGTWYSIRERAMNSFSKSRAHLPTSKGACWIWNITSPFITASSSERDAHQLAMSLTWQRIRPLYLMFDFWATAIIVNFIPFVANAIAVSQSSLDSLTWWWITASVMSRIPRIRSCCIIFSRLGYFVFWM